MAAVAAGGRAAVVAIAASGATDRAVAVVAGGPTAEAAAVNVAAAAAATDLTQSLFSIIPIFSCLVLGLLRRLSSLDTSSRHQ